MRATTVITATLLATLSLAGCRSVPTGAGVYKFTISDAATGDPIEGVELVARRVGQPGSTGVKATTDEDGIAVLRFGAWGAVGLELHEGAAVEKWLVTQDRVAVNGGKASRDPARMIVGSDGDGGITAYIVDVTRVERGGKVDN
jgi:hypothetical protein